MRKLTAIFVFVLVLLFSVQSHVLAQTASPSPRLGQQLRQNAQDLRKDIRQDFKASSSTVSGKQQACVAHIAVVKTRELALSNRSELLKLRLDKIVTMVQNYYTNKMVPAGQTVSNYTTLVADVNSKKAALAPLVDKVKTDSSSLTCDNNRAAGQFLTFRTDAKNLITAFHAYRLSVVNLIVAVRSAASESASVSPTVTPEVTP